MLERVDSENKGMMYAEIEDGRGNRRRWWETVYSGSEFVSRFPFCSIDWPTRSQRSYVHCKVGLQILTINFAVNY